MPQLFRLAGRGTNKFEMPYYRTDDLQNQNILKIWQDVIKNFIYILCPKEK